MTTWHALVGEYRDAIDDAIAGATPRDRARLERAAAHLRGQCDARSLRNAGRILRGATTAHAIRLGESLGWAADVAQAAKETGDRR